MSYLSISHPLKTPFIIMSYLCLPFLRHQKPLHLSSWNIFFQPFNHLCCLYLQLLQFLHIPLNSSDPESFPNSDYNLTNSEHEEIIALHFRISSSFLESQGLCHNHLTMSMPGCCYLCPDIIADLSFMRVMFRGLLSK